MTDLMTTIASSKNFESEGELLLPISWLIIMYPIDETSMQWGYPIARHTDIGLVGNGVSTWISRNLPGLDRLQGTQQPREFRFFVILVDAQQLYALLQVIPSRQ